MLTLYLPHPLFVLNSEVFTDEFGIDCYDLNNLVPELEYLRPNLIQILHELEGYLVGVTQIYPLREGHN